MKKEKELEYSRALVPMKNKIYKRILVCFIAILSIIIMAYSVSICLKDTEREVKSRGEIDIVNSLNQEIDE